VVAVVTVDDGSELIIAASPVAAEWVASVLTAGPEMLITTPVTSVSIVARIFIFGP
jgi:hypothetical protein